MADQHDHSHDSHHHDSNDCSTERGHEDHSKWVEIERLYQEKSTEEQAVINWFTEHVKDYLPADIPESPDAEFSILSFGCGDGTKDQSALRAIVSSLAPGARVYYCAVDPDEKSIEKFKKAVKEDTESPASLLKKVMQFDFHVQTYESYVETKASATGSGPGKTKDLILFIDSLCHFSCDLKDALVHCYERELSSKGVMVILLWNRDDFWFKIRKRFSDGTKVASADEGNDYVTVQDVMQVAEEYKWRFQMHTPQYSLDVSECFKPDSEQGVKILECLACYSNLQGPAADVSSGGLLEFLHDEAECKGSARVLNGNLGILVVYK